MTPEQFRQHHDEHAPRIIAFVRNATEPVYISDIVEAMAPARAMRGSNWKANVLWHDKRDDIRRLVWSMIDHEAGPAELVLNNDLSVSVKGDNDE